MSSGEAVREAGEGRGRLKRGRELGGEEKDASYPPGLEAMGSPFLLHKRHMRLHVVVHVEVGTLGVDDDGGGHDCCVFSRGQLPLWL